MIRTQGLTKSYRERVAVSELDLQVGAGQVYGFLGPNGAGKSTTIGMLLGLVAPTTGEVWLLGQTIRALPLGERRRIGVMGEQQYLYDDMPVDEYLRFFADLYRVANARRRIDELIEILGLAGHKRSRAGTLSRGLRQKLALARALVHDPELLILDEPTAGLDPAGIREVRTLIQAEHARGKTILLSSHILSEIERAADRVGILAGGRLLAEGDIAHLRALAGDAPTLQVEIAEPAQAAAAAISSLPEVRDVRAEGHMLDVRFGDGDGAADQDRRILVSRTLAKAQVTVLGMQWHAMSLEEAFVTITESNVGALAKGLAPK